LARPRLRPLPYAPLFPSTSQDQHRERGIRSPTQHDSTSSHSRPPRRSRGGGACSCGSSFFGAGALGGDGGSSLTEEPQEQAPPRSEEHTSQLQSRFDLVS